MLTEVVLDVNVALTGDFLFFYSDCIDEKCI